MLGAGENAHPDPYWFLVVFGKLESWAALNDLFDFLPDGRIRFDNTDVAFTYNFGLLVEAQADTRIGLTCFSGIVLELEDNKTGGAGPTLDGCWRFQDLRVATTSRISHSTSAGPIIAQPRSTTISDCVFCV